MTTGPTLEGGGGDQEMDEDLFKYLNAEDQLDIHGNEGFQSQQQQRYTTTQHHNNNNNNNNNKLRHPYTTHPSPPPNPPSPQLGIAPTGGLLGGVGDGAAATIASQQHHLGHNNVAPPQPQPHQSIPSPMGPAFAPVSGFVDSFYPLK